MPDQTKQTFCVVYDGEAHEHHEMPIHALGSSLTNLGDLLVYANEVVNENNHEFEVKVNAHFIEGSFGYVVEVTQNLEHAVNILPVIGVAVGGTVTGGVLGVLNWLKGNKIQKITNKNGVTKIITKNGEKECSSAEAKLVANKKIRNSINNLIRKPLQHEGTSTFKIKNKRDDKSSIIIIDRKTSSSYTTLKYQNITEEKTIEKRVKFIAADIKKKTGWKIDVDGVEISTRMEDDGFRERLANMKEINIFGKSINIKLKSIFKTVADIDQPIKYEIEHVFIGSEK
ncbi:MAG: hypothetical protein RPS47_18375 [Colwellia sp.]